MQRRVFLQSTGLAAIGARLATPSPGAASPGAASTGAASPGSAPVAFTVAIRVKPGRDAEFLDLLHPVLDAMRGEETFINAILLRDPGDPTRFLIYETWADLDDVRDVQLHRPYRRTYSERLPDLLAEEREIGVWQPLRSDMEPCLPPG